MASISQIQFTGRERPLVDIGTVAVDKSLPKKERLAEYVRQIKNPYCFTCDGFIVHASFTSDGVCMEDRIQGIMK